MFSYRHGFHAGNHADVLKHTVLIALLRYLTAKDTPLTFLDTHAGAGIYRLDGDFAATSGEAAEGVLKLAEGPVEHPLLADYLDLVRSFNPAGRLNVYPGSPFVAERLLRGDDKLKLFELHPSDSKALNANIAQLEAGRRIAVLRENGFEAARRFLPPPSRRALVLCDPSYELKADYPAVAGLLEEGLQRFATGTYAIWYPVIPRPEAHALPRRLKTLAQRAGKPWLHATLTIKASRPSVAQRVAADQEGRTARPGLTSSGMFIVNPPYTLANELRPALTEAAARLGADKNAGFLVEAGG